MSALREAGTQEDRVDANQDPGPALEESGSEQQTNPEHDLEAGNDSHGGVVVLLDEEANLVSQGAVNLGLRGGARRGARRGAGSGTVSGSLGRRDGGDHIGAGVSSDVEDRVHRVRQEGEGILRHEEPDEGHDWSTGC